MPHVFVMIVTHHSCRIEAYGNANRCYEKQTKSFGCHICFSQLTLALRRAVYRGASDAWLAMILLSLWTEDRSQDEPNQGNKASHREAPVCLELPRKPERLVWCCYMEDSVRSSPVRREREDAEERSAGREVTEPPTEEPRPAGAGPRHETGDEECQHGGRDNQECCEQGRPDDLHKRHAMSLCNGYCLCHIVLANIPHPYGMLLCWIIFPTIYSERLQHDHGYLLIVYLR